MKKVLFFLSFFQLGFIFFSNAQAPFYSINITATIEKIECINAYDGNSDNTEEIYGEIRVRPGYVCFDVDVDVGEDHGPVNFKGIGKWELKPDNYYRMKKGDIRYINYTSSWTYYFPPKCDENPTQQSVVRCESNLDERDMPHDADDKLNEPCGGTCHDDIYLSQVKQQGKKTFRFQQRHESGGSKFVVYFKIETITSLTEEVIFQKISGLTPTPLYLLSNQDKSVGVLLFQDGAKSIEVNLFTGNINEIELGKGEIYEEYVFEKQRIIKVMKAEKKNMLREFCDWWDPSVDPHCNQAACDYMVCSITNDCGGESLTYLYEKLTLLCFPNATISISDLSNSKPPLKKAE